jgi:NTE family protein
MSQDQRQQGIESVPTSGLVLGGGGPVGATWMSVLVDGLVSAGLPLAESDVVMGTSAGAVVGAWLTMQADGLASLPDRMRERAAWHAANDGPGRVKMDPRQRMAASGAEADAVRSLAQAAVEAVAPVSADQAETTWRRALPEGKWPTELRVVSVNASTGIARAWGREDGISLPVAVACSTAAPGAAPPVMVADAAWVDGGVRSATNADLIAASTGDSDRAAVGAHRVLIVAPVATGGVEREKAVLADRGYDVRVVVAEPFYDKPADLLDPGFIDAAVAAGARQARAIADDLRKWWLR